MAMQVDLPIQDLKEVLDKIIQIPKDLKVVSATPREDGGVTLVFDDDEE